MVELDNEVMIGCAKHMRSVCGHFLDEGNRKGSNYEVICGDALKYMERVIVSKFISFDYVTKNPTLFGRSKYTGISVFSTGVKRTF